MRSLRILFAMAVVCSASICSAQLPDKATIVFLGDSITQQGEGEKGYVTLFRKALETSRPDAGIRVIGAGIGGNKVPDLEKRLDRDVLAHKPNVVVIYIGINDVWHSVRDQGTSPERYAAGLKNLIQRCQQSGATVLLATPSVIGEKTDGSNDLDSMLNQFAELSRTAAVEHHVPLVDLRTAFVNYLTAYNVANSHQGVLTTDGVHLNDKGNRFVAVRMLEAVGEQPAPKRLLRHIVLFKFKPEVTPKQFDEINLAFHQLKYEITEIHDFERGVNNSPEGLDKGFTHGYTVTFTSEAGREAYLPHPAHKKFVQLIEGKVEDVMVFDYWTVE